MFPIVLSAAILTTIFASSIDFNDCLRSPETIVNLTNQSTVDEINKKFPRNVLYYVPELNDVLYFYMKFTAPMYMFVKLLRDYRFGIPVYQYGAVDNGTMAKTEPDIYGDVYKMGLEKCTTTINNDEPPHDKSAADPESTMPDDVRRNKNRYIDLGQPL